MKATTFVHAIAAHTYDTIPTQVMHLCDRSDLSKIFGQGGKCYAIGINGIPESDYLYLYPDSDTQQAEFLEDLKHMGEVYENNPNIVDAVCTDATGQLIVIINVMEG